MKAGCCFCARGHQPRGSPLMKVFYEDLVGKDACGRRQGRGLQSFRLEAYPDQDWMKEREMHKARSNLAKRAIGNPLLDGQLNFTGSGCGQLVTTLVVVRGTVGDISNENERVLPILEKEQRIVTDHARD